MLISSIPASSRTSDIRCVNSSAPAVPTHSKAFATVAQNKMLAADSPWRGELRIPSSAQALLELSAAARLIPQFTRRH